MDRPPANYRYRCATLPDLDPRSADEILGYDENGLPSMAADPTLLLSAISQLEAGIVLQARKDASARHELRQFLDESGIAVMPFGRQHAELAQRAWEQYGRGRYRASLNLGDCCSYALAKATGEPLLYKGEDFRLTDLAGVIHR